MAQQRMLTDATNRLPVLYDHLDKGTLNERIVKQVEDMVEGGCSIAMEGHDCAM